MGSHKKAQNAQHNGCFCAFCIASLWPIRFHSISAAISACIVCASARSESDALTDTPADIFAVMAGAVGRRARVAARCEPSGGVHGGGAVGFIRPHQAGFLRVCRGWSPVPHGFGASCHPTLRQVMGLVKQILFPR